MNAASVIRRVSYLYSEYETRNFHRGVNIDQATLGHIPKNFTFTITDLRPLDIERLSNVYFSPNIAMVMIKSGWVKCGTVATSTHGTNNGLERGRLCIL